MHDEQDRLFRQERVGSLLVSTVGPNHFLDEHETMIFRVKPDDRVDYSGLYHRHHDTDAEAIVHGGLIAAMLRMGMTLASLNAMDF